MTNKPSGIPPALTQKLQAMADTVERVQTVFTPKSEEKKIEAKVAEYQKEGLRGSEGELRRHARAELVLEKVFKPTTPAQGFAEQKASLENTAISIENAIKAAPKVASDIGKAARKVTDFLGNL